MTRGYDTFWDEYEAMVEDAGRVGSEQAKRLNPETVAGADVVSEPDAERDYDDAVWAARNPNVEEWVEITQSDGSWVSVPALRGRAPARAIGTMAGELAARAHRLLEHLVVLDRRAVIVVRPHLVEDGAFAYRFVEKPSTAKRFYDSPEEARTAAKRIVAHLSKSGPVRLYEPEPLRVSDYDSEALRRWKLRKLAERRDVALAKLSEGLETSVLPAWDHLVAV